MGPLSNQTLPTISFLEENLDVGSSSWLSTSKEVVRALERYGCFIATFTNFSPELHHAIFEACKELFDLPTQVKRLNTSDRPSHRYAGDEPVRPLFEGLGIENATTEEGVQRFTNLMWPSGNKSFSETALEYSKLVSELDEVVMKMVSEVYGITNSYESLIQNKFHLLRLIKYRVPKEGENGTGIVPHTDKSFMSILHQFQVKGLEIQTKDGDWIGVDPSPSTFLVMAGDAFMAWTNGKIESPSHRVLMGGSEEERYSVGTFVFVKDVEIKVPEELVDEEHPLQFKPFDNLKFVQFVYTEESQRAKSQIRAYCGV